MNRSSGILVHPTSLPSQHGIGDLGPAAHEFLSWLGRAGARWWQVLPLCPPGPGFSPYSGTSTFAGNPWLISPDLLVEDGLLNRAEISHPPTFPQGRVDLNRMQRWKRTLFETAWSRFQSMGAGELSEAHQAFCLDQRRWLRDFALFSALKEHHGGDSWLDWEPAVVRREPEALEAAERQLSGPIGLHQFLQFLFFRQWGRLKSAAEAAGISLMGDVPIFVAMDSAEVWARPELFHLDASRRPTVVAGVPPDYFSATGQRWGNPLYNWERHEEEDFAWWIARTVHTLETVDLVRLDHFRGFAACWEIPTDCPTAVDGRWVPGPGRKLFDALQRAVGGLPFVAEDLGEITPDVLELRDGLGLPGMAILHFAFSPHPRSTFLPYRLRPASVVYTGTHDNNTTVGWYREDATDAERDFVRRYAASDGTDIHWDLIRLALASVADLAIVPFQDLLGLGSEARMNTPGRPDGNWLYRLADGDDDPGTADRFRSLVETYGRLEAEPSDSSSNP